MNIFFIYFVSTINEIRKQSHFSRDVFETIAVCWRTKFHSEKSIRMLWIYRIQIFNFECITNAPTIKLNNEQKMIDLTIDFIQPSIYLEANVLKYKDYKQVPTKFSQQSKLNQFPQSFQCRKKKPNETHIEMLWNNVEVQTIPNIEFFPWKMFALNLKFEIVFSFSLLFKSF